MKSLRTIALALTVTFSAGVSTSVCGADASELGRTLTPLGAEKAGNADSSIPAWDGGLTRAPAGFKPDGHYPDPYADDKPLFTITPANVDQYKEHLTPGQLALFAKYPSYKLVVYPTHRSAAFPQQHYDETMANPQRARLVEGGNGVVGTSGGVAFPIPEDGTEAIWSTLTRYRGETYENPWSQVAMTRAGDYTPVHYNNEYDFQYGSIEKPPAQRMPNMIGYYVQVITAPARLAGLVVLIHETLDQVREARQSWIYSPGLRRVKLVPTINYDTPAAGTDNLRTSDDFQLFNGATDRYEWQLLGKKEIYIPYNSYRISGNTVKITDIIRPHHINQDLARYELHRVRVVEATLKPGLNHVYSKRRFYLDEDSWQPVLSDQYDRRGQLWRVGEAHSIQLYDKPMLFETVEMHYDLYADRYLAAGLGCEEPYLLRRINRTEADYTPENLRNLGVR
jgi:hypothetical protein